MSLVGRVRTWLGLSDLPSLTMFKAMEQKQVERHEQLTGAINRLAVALQNAHAMDKPQFVPPVLDWDTVQAMALVELERKPQKEQ
ncbi:MAG: hypothetical protein WBD73_09910 [Candidatus Acidiferrales bacterium]